MALQLPQLPLASSSSCLETPRILFHNNHHSSKFRLTTPTATCINHRRRRRPGLVFAAKEEAGLGISAAQAEQVQEPSPEDLEYVAQIKRVLELLRKNRDMLFNEVKLTIMIEDAREVERRRLLGIEDPDTPTRDELVYALEDVNEDRVPENRVALRMLAEELMQWPNLEVEIPKKKPTKSLYAKATDTGIDPEVAAKRLNIDWDSAAEIEETDASDEADVPPAVESWLPRSLIKASDVSPAMSEHAQKGDEINKELDDLFISMEGIHKSESLVVRKPNTHHGKGSPRCMVDKEISVDPRSLKQSAISEEVSSSPESPVTTPSKQVKLYLPKLSLTPPKSKFLSSSLPSSATTSPRSGSTLIKNLKKWRNQGQTSHPRVGALARQHSTAISNIAPRQESYLRRSKSCGEGRASAPPDEFDGWVSNAHSARHEDYDRESCCESEANAVSHKNKDTKELDSKDEGFRCGAMCMFLPGFGKGKPVKAKKNQGAAMGNAISRTVSLEKFECGSWTSSAIINDDDENGDSMHLYFDLPLELIRSSMNDAHSPVAAAFVFDKNRKGVLKSSTSSRAATTARKSHESSRHVRFSSSTPPSYPASPASCITPRLRKAREDFNAFLEAQSA